MLSLCVHAISLCARKLSGAKGDVCVSFGSNEAFWDVYDYFGDAYDAFGDDYDAFGDACDACGYD